MDKWRKYAMQTSGAKERLADVPVYIDINGALVEVTDVVEDNGKIILKTQ